MNFKNSSLMYINILTSVQYWDCILKGVFLSKRQYVLVTCTEICISTERTSLQDTLEYKYILQMYLIIPPWYYQISLMLTHQCG